MTYLILRLLIAALLALPGVVAEETTTGLEGGVTETCDPDAGCNPDEPHTIPSELPGPSA